MCLCGHYLTCCTPFHPGGVTPQRPILHQPHTPQQATPTPPFLAPLNPPFSPLNPTTLHHLRGTHHSGVIPHCQCMLGRHSHPPPLTLTHWATVLLLPRTPSFVVQVSFHCVDFLHTLACLCWRVGSMDPMDVDSMDPTHHQRKANVCKKSKREQGKKPLTKEGVARIAPSDPPTHSHHPFHQPPPPLPPPTHTHTPTPAPTTNPCRSLPLPPTQPHTLTSALPSHTTTHTYPP